MRVAVSLVVGWCAIALTAAVAYAASWQPPGIAPASARLADVLALHALHAGSPPPAFAQRVEHYRLRSGNRNFALEVVVRGADFSSSLTLGTARYGAGRRNGLTWRSSADGIVRTIRADLDDNLADRLPASIFGLQAAYCTLAGQTTRGEPAWVIAEHLPTDVPRWIFIAKSDGRIVREVTHHGLEVRTTFGPEEVREGVRRIVRWHVADDSPGGSFDVTLTGTSVRPLSSADVTAPLAGADLIRFPPGVSRAVVPATFAGDTIFVNLTINGTERRFLLDSGTEDITLSRWTAQELALDVALDHATLPRLDIGDLTMENVSTSISDQNFEGDGILGYDFFAGHVVHIDYARRQVEVLTTGAADRELAANGAVPVAIILEGGTPLAHAEVGGATGARFLLDTGSPDVVLFQRFLTRNAASIARAWTYAPADGTSVEPYLEGPVIVRTAHIPSFALGPLRSAISTVRAEIPGGSDIDIPFDGILGTKALRTYELWFDDDRHRVWLRGAP
jgi:hypothetical protein